MARKTTTTKKKTTTKAKTTPAPAATADKAQEVTVLPTPDVIGTLSKKELIEHVVEASGVKKKDAKPVIEATLRALGEALSRGDTLNLQPMGKGIVKSRKALENAEVIELRFRRSKQSIEGGANEPIESDVDGGDTPLADAAE